MRGQLSHPSVRYEGQSKRKIRSEKLELEQSLRSDDTPNFPPGRVDPAVFSGLSPRYHATLRLSSRCLLLSCEEKDVQILGSARSLRADDGAASETIAHEKISPHGGGRRETLGPVPGAGDKPSPALDPLLWRFSVPSAHGCVHRAGPSWRQPRARVPPRSPPIKWSRSMCWGERPSVQAECEPGARGRWAAISIATSTKSQGGVRRER